MNLLKTKTDIQQLVIETNDGVFTVDLLGEDEGLPPTAPRLRTRLIRTCRRAVGAARRLRAKVRRHPTLNKVLLASTSVATIAFLACWEFQTSSLDAFVAAHVTPLLGYSVESGANPEMRHPPTGPFDRELGYAGLERMTERFKDAGYEIKSQARLSALHDALVRSGLYPIYQEKTEHGLAIADTNGSAMLAAQYPRVGYARLADVPPLVLEILLFIEDRQILDSDRAATSNPAVSWERLGKASLDLTLDMFVGGKAPGGSTLATQLEKFRHSSGGRTRAPADKLRQMASASARAYLLGEDTRAAREQIALDYINSVPLGAVPGLGAVNGLGDGLVAWYGDDLMRVSALIAEADPEPMDQVGRAARALAFKRTLALFLAQRRPTYYLQQDQRALGELADTHIRLMMRAGKISAQLACDAITMPLGLIAPKVVRSAPEGDSFVGRKAVNSLRMELKRLLGAGTLYEVDRLDATVRSTFDLNLQAAVSNRLVAMRTAEGAKAAGLINLNPDQAAAVTYSFTLLERVDDHNVVRVQTDTQDSPLDLNRGGKLELGSTAKLRTLITYLEMISESYGDLAPKAQDRAALAAARAATSKEDEMTQWVIDQLTIDPDATLVDVLDAAVYQRHFSGSPGQAFRTGGGVLRFGNFERSEDYGEWNVIRAFQASNNLVFIRIMKDVVQHAIMSRIPDAAAMLADENHPGRKIYLDRFVDKESSSFLRKFYTELQPLSADQRYLKMAFGRVLTTTRMASIILSVHPEMGYGDFLNEMLAQFPELSDVAILRYWKTIHPSAMSLHDRAYVARVHPLELWLTAFLETHPDATYAEALAASHDARFDSYAWLYERAGPKKQEQYVRDMLEIEAFQKHILPYWKRQGFPFDTMTASYAAVLGSSGDKPFALAELAGAVENYGVMLPTMQIDSINIGSGTPFETVFGRSWVGAHRVCSEEVAAEVKKAMEAVVDGGTAVRLKDALKRSNGSSIIIAAKTGTGDNRLESYDQKGRVIKSEAKSRTATVVFALGDRFFGTLTAFVKNDPAVEKFSFTSSLAVQALRSMMPVLERRVLEVEDPDLVGSADLLPMDAVD